MRNYIAPYSQSLVRRFVKDTMSLANKKAPLGSPPDNVGRHMLQTSLGQGGMCAISVIGVFDKKGHELHTRAAISYNIVVLIIRDSPKNDWNTLVKFVVAIVLHFTKVVAKGKVAVLKTAGEGTHLGVRAYPAKYFSLILREKLLHHFDEALIFLRPFKPVDEYS